MDSLLAPGLEARRAALKAQQVRVRAQVERIGVEGSVDSRQSSAHEDAQSMPHEMRETPPRQNRLGDSINPPRSGVKDGHWMTTMKEDTTGGFGDRADHDGRRCFRQKLADQIDGSRPSAMPCEATRSPELVKVEVRLHGLELMLQTMADKMQEQTLEHNRLETDLEQARQQAAAAVARALVAEEQAALWRKAAADALAVTQQREAAVIVAKEDSHKAEIAKLREELEASKAEAAKAIEHDACGRNGSGDQWEYVSPP